MHKLHQDRRWGGGKCRILRVPRFSSWQIWRHRGKHQETTFARENCIYQASEYLKLRQIGPENQAAHLELKQDVLAVLWSRNTYIHTFYFFTFRITEWTCPRIAYASPGGSWLQEWNERIVKADNDWPQQTGMCFTARSCGDFGPAI